MFNWRMIALRCEESFLLRFTICFGNLLLSLYLVITTDFLMTVPVFSLAELRTVIDLTTSCAFQQSIPATVLATLRETTVQTKLVFKLVSWNRSPKGNSLDSYQTIIMDAIVWQEKSSCHPLTHLEIICYYECLVKRMKIPSEWSIPATRDLSREVRVSVRD